MQFKFNSSVLNSFPSPNIYLGLGEHNQEFIERVFHLFFLFLVFVSTSLMKAKELTQFFQSIIPEVRFFQPSPSEYFFLTLKSAFYLSIFLEIPFLVLYILCYLFPAFWTREKFAFSLLTILFIVLFGSGSFYAYKILIPLAINFFFLSTKDILEPLWAFNDYLEFLFVICFGSIISFQLPTVQIFLGFIGLFSSKNSLKWFRYLVVASTIGGAILTPSTDPFSQLLVSSVLIILYTIGVLLLLILEKFNVLG